MNSKTLSVGILVYFWASNAMFAQSINALRVDDLSAGRQLLEAHRPLEALSYFRHMSQTKPNDPNPYFWQGVALDEAQDLHAAAEAYSKSVELARQAGLDSAALRVNLANCMVKLHYFEQALFDYIRAIEIEPKLIAAHLGLGRLLALKGDNKAALDEFQKCASLGYTDPSLCYLKGLALKNLGNTIEAQNELNLCLNALSSGRETTVGNQKLQTLSENLLKELSTSE
jgi:Flp pilus assembly protein TadD